jgi:hypothetical protein
MKFIKKFENFHDDGLNIDNQTLPEFNQNDRLKAKEYVENIFNAGAGRMVNALCKEIKVKMPRTEEELEKTKNAAISYFIQNPERIKEITPPEHKKYQYNSGDGIARVTNIGGVHHDKTVS